MKPEREIVAATVASGANASEPAMVVLPEPQTELGAKLIALAKKIDESDTPKLSLAEIEEYLGRELGGIAEALGDRAIARRASKSFQFVEAQFRSGVFV